MADFHIRIWRIPGFYKNYTQHWALFSTKTNQGRFYFHWAYGRAYILNVFFITKNVNIFKIINIQYVCNQREGNILENYVLCLDYVQILLFPFFAVPTFFSSNFQWFSLFFLLEPITLIKRSLCLQTFFPFLSTFVIPNILTRKR